MARRETGQTQQKAVVDESVKDNGSPALADGHDRIVEEAPGIGGAKDVSAPTGDPGDMSTVAGSSLLPDDLGFADDPALSDVTNPGGDLGSTLLDDLTSDASDRPDPTDGFDGASDGWNAPVIDDQSGWAMDDGDKWNFEDDPLYATDPTGDSTSSSEYFDSSVFAARRARIEFDRGDDAGGRRSMLDSANAFSAGAEAARDEALDAAAGTGVHMFDTGSDMIEISPTVTRVGGSVRQDENYREETPPSDSSRIYEQREDRGIGSRPRGPRSGEPDSQTMPAPDDGTGGKPDADDFIGGRGDVDPAPETDPVGGAIELIGERGDADPAPETEDSGGAVALDLVRAGMGAVDPLDSESTLLGGDTGDLAEMAVEADLGGDLEVEFDDSLADADIGEDV